MKHRALANELTEHLREITVVKGLVMNQVTELVTEVDRYNRLPAGLIHIDNASKVTAFFCNNFLSHR